MSNTYLTHLWAKSEPHHPLWCHLFDTAAVARALLARFGPIEGLPLGWIEFFVGSHDVGKADPWFQNKDPQRAANLVELGLPVPAWSREGGEKYYAFRHESRSDEWVKSWLQRTQGWGKPARVTVGRAIVGHHGDWSPLIPYSEVRGEIAPIWGELRDELGALLWRTIAPEPVALPEFPHAGAAGAKLAAYIILSDWIASNHELFPYETLHQHTSPTAYFEAACALAQSVVKQMGLEGEAPLETAEKPAFQRVWPKIKKPRPLQTALDSLRDTLPPGLAIIEAPMGEGKTEAALYLAQIWAAGIATRGVYFALPTQATANAMHARYEKFLGDLYFDAPRRRPRLLHGMSWMNEESAPSSLEYLPELDAQNDPKLALTQARNARDWFRPMRRALLSSEGVGTVDQALLAGLRVKFGPLRLLGLSQKTLIIDECHAYDEFMSELLKSLLQWCRALEINVILLSATLSQNQKLELARAYADSDTDLTPLEASDPTKVPYPQLSFVPRGARAFPVAVAADSSRTRTLDLDLKRGLLDDFVATARHAVHLAYNGQCVCVLANTVKAAQEIYRHLSAMKQEGQLPQDCDLDLFHARFRTEARAKIEARVVKKFGPDEEGVSNPLRPRCAILVATQVVEQSLDVDFDALSSQIAPIDLLLQRAGRLWRHQRAGRMGNPRLTVLLPPQGELAFGASGKVYALEILLRSLAILNGQSQWKLPDDFRPLIEKCYRRDENLGDFAAQQDDFLAQLHQAQEERDKEQNKARQEAQIHQWIEPRADDFSPAARVAKEREDNEGDDEKANKYFVARTRLGDESINLLPLLKSEHLAIAKLDQENEHLPRREQEMPTRKQLISIFEQKVGVPHWWLQNAQPLDGFQEIQTGKSFLRGHKVLVLREISNERVWRGHNPDGEFVIIDHPELGLLRRALTQDASPREEADAGYNTSA